MLQELDFREKHRFLRPTTLQTSSTVYTATYPVNTGSISPAGKAARRVRLPTLEMHRVLYALYRRL